MYIRWILANGVSESLGLGSTFLIGIVVAPWLTTEAGPMGVVATATAAVALGTLLEGIVVGVAQELVIAREFRGLRLGGWTKATAIGAGLAWLLGMIPSSIAALTDASASGAPAGEPSALAQYGLAALLGLVLGPVLGIAQWVVLRRVVDKAAGHWLWANALAWAVGMPVIFIGMDWSPWNGPVPLLAVSVYLTCFVAGCVVGGIHGRALVWLRSRAVGP